MNVEFSYTLSKENLINFHVNNFIRTKKYKNNFFSALFLYCLLVFIVLFIFNIDIIYISPIIALCIFNKKIILIEFKTNLKSHYSLNKYEDMFATSTIIINTSNITVSTNLGTKVYNWCCISEIFIVEGSLNSDNFMIIYTLASNNLIIPIGRTYEFANIKNKLEKLILDNNITLHYNYPYDELYFN